MDNKFYVSYEAARLLKGKGYNEAVGLYYNTLGELINVSDMFYREVADNIQMAKYDYLSAPTKAEAIDWLESKGIVIELSYDDQGHMDNARWHYFIYTNDEDGWVEGMVCSWMEGNYFKTRLEAEEAVIVKACELL
jgi:hypothetical protein